MNKARVEAVVEDAVTSLLDGFRQGGRGPILAPDSGPPPATKVLEVAKRDVTSLAWLTKALAMRCAPKKSMDQALSLLIDVAGLVSCSSTEEGKKISPESVALALHAAESFAVIFRVPLAGTSLAASASSSILAPHPTLVRVNPLWRQRLFYLSFSRLRQSVEKHQKQPQAKAAALLAVCNIVAGLPKSIIHSELENIVIVVIQGMSSSNPTLCARATETFAVLVKDSVEAIVPHLSTIIPLLYNLCTPR